MGHGRLRGHVRSANAANSSLHRPNLLVGKVGADAGFFVGALFVAQT